MCCENRRALPTKRGVVDGGRLLQRGSIIVGVLKDNARQLGADWLCACLERLQLGPGMQDVGGLSPSSCEAVSCSVAVGHAALSAAACSTIIPVQQLPAAAHEPKTMCPKARDPMAPMVSCLQQP